MAQWKVRCQRCGPRQMRQARLLLKVHHGLGISQSHVRGPRSRGVRSGFEFFVHGRIAVFVERPFSFWALRKVVQEACNGDQFVESDVT